MELHERIATRREELGWSQGALGDRAGTNQQSIARIEKGSNSKYLNAVLEALGLDTKGRLIDASTKDDVVLAEGYREPPQLIGKLDLPVYAAVEGGPGEMLISTEAIDVVTRPWFLQHVPNAYAVVVTGESMEPVYEAGDIVLVNPRLPPIKNKDAIFTSERYGGDFKASLKRFVRSTEDHWIAKQFNPPKGQKEELRFAKGEWREALRVVGKYVP